MSPRERGVARIDLDAVRHNVRHLARTAPRSELLVVVKANGYGHGDIAVAKAALEAGASRLGVAAVTEAEDLRRAGITAPILMWGPMIGDEWGRAAAADCEVALWTPEGCHAAAAVGVRRVHLKLDSGMGRMGVRPESLPALADAADDPAFTVVGLMTHFATADETEGPNAAFMVEQLARFRSMATPLRSRFPEAILHAANSAAVLRNPDTHLDMVRCGIAIYGCSPFMTDPADHDLRPAMALESYLASVKPILGRESVGYGRLWRAARGTTIGAIPVGYADGYCRSYANRAEVLVGGRRVPVVGMVSMDQITVDLGPESTDRVGDPVVLMGTQGDESITAEDLGRWRDSINYEVVCAVGERMRRETGE